MAPRKRVFIVRMTWRPLLELLVRDLSPRSRSHDLDLESYSNVVHTVLVSEMVRDEEEDRAFFDFLPLWRGKTFVTFYWLRRRRASRAIELSLDGFNENSVFDGSGSMSLSFFFGTTSLIFLLVVRPMSSVGSPASDGCLGSISTRTFINTSDWDNQLRLLVSVVFRASLWSSSIRAISKMRKKQLFITILAASTHSTEALGNVFSMLCITTSVIGEIALWLRSVTTKGFIVEREGTSSRTSIGCLILFLCWSDPRSDWADGSVA